MKSSMLRYALGMAVLMEEMKGGLESPARGATKNPAPHAKAPLTKKQVKSRKRAKAAKKARKRGK